MADYAGEPVPVIVSEPVDENGRVLDNTNATAEVEIVSQDHSVTYVARTPMAWIDGAFEYTWDTTGRDPGLYLTQVWVTPNGGFSSFEWSTIRLAARPGTPTCGGPWVNPESIPELAGLEENDRWLVVQAASDMLYAASGRQFGGICDDVVRPPSANVTGGAGMFAGERLADGSLWLGYNGTDTLPESTFGLGGFPTTDVVEAGGFVSSTVHLPGFPIVDVTRISIDGVDLPDGTGPDPKAWRIVDDRWVIRADGRSWPIWQRLDRTLGDVDTWAIYYSWGDPVPAGGQLAARVLSAELGKSMRGDSGCRLPKRLQSITREGMTAVILDPFTFLDKGRFGIYEIDSWIQTVNPSGLSRDAKVLNVDLMRMTPRRVR